MEKQQPDQPSANKYQEKMPVEISDYIKKYFDGEFLTEIHTFNDKNNQLVYAVDISHDNTLYHLKFNSEGTLVQRETEPLIELYDDEEPDVE